MRCWMLCRLEYKQTLKRRITAELLVNCHEKQPYIWNSAYCSNSEKKKKGKAQTIFLNIYYFN